MSMNVCAMSRQPLTILLVGILSASCKTASTGQAAAPPSGAPALVQPGAPGQATRDITAREATDVSRVQFNDADVKFMQGMIGHHQQALEMAALIPDRTASDSMKQLGLKVDLSQRDEIRMMQGWLRVRGQEIPEEHAMHMHGATLMPGMLTEEEMARLAAAKGVAFDKLWLEGMIKHHAGALTMVRELFATAGAGQDSEIYAFASDVDADQTMEIDRMSAMRMELEK